MQTTSILSFTIKADEDLQNVTVIAININDIISTPPPNANFARRTAAAYKHFEEVLKQIFDTTGLEKLHETHAS